MPLLVFLSISAVLSGVPQSQAGWFHKPKSLPLSPMEKVPVLSLTPQKSDVSVTSLQESSGLAQLKPLETQEEIPEDKKKQLDISSDTLTYDDKLKAYILTGHVHMVVEDQNAVLDADKVTYQPELDIVVAEGNITLVKEGTTTEAAYMRLRLDGQTALVNDATVSLGFVRLRAKTVLGRPDLTHMKDGALLMVPRQAFEQTRSRSGTRFVGGNPANGIVVQAGYNPYSLNSKRTQRFVDADNLRTNPLEEAQQFLNALTRKGFDTSEVALNREEKPIVQFLSFKVKDIEITEHPNEYYMVDFKSPRIKLKNLLSLPLPNVDVGIDKKNSRLDYLGPELGFNRDLGGFFVNPGFDFKVGPGALKLSPMVSYGQTINRNGTSIDIRQPEFGYGVMSSYRSKRLNLMAARNFKNDYNVLEAEVYLSKKGRNTRLIGSQNAFAGSSFFTQERPSYSLQLEDRRNFLKGKLFGLQAVHSAGVFKDDLFPFNSGNPFVVNTSNSPVTAGRFRQQLVLANTRPLFKIGKNIELGANLQASNAYYTTGDVVSVLRGGPTANFFLGDFFMSQVSYNLGAVSGKSPFVFDSFFLGNQTVSLNNAVRLGSYALLGFRQDFNLSNTNARNDALVGNTIYLTMGPRNVKFTIGYDTIFRRTNFGISYYPNTSQTEIAFENAYLNSAVSPMNPQEMESFRKWNRDKAKDRDAVPAAFQFPWQQKKRG
jgi:hypothetical protein